MAKELIMVSLIIIDQTLTWYAREISAATLPFLYLMERLYRSKKIVNFPINDTNLTILLQPLIRLDLPQQN